MAIVDERPAAALIDALDCSHTLKVDGIGKLGERMRRPVSVPPEPPSCFYWRSISDPTGTGSMARNIGSGMQARR